MSWPVRREIHWRRIGIAPRVAGWTAPGGWRPRGATVMAKGQKRSNKEPKKPKADKKKVLATAGTVAGTMAKPKAGVVTGGGKK